MFEDGDTLLPIPSTDPSGSWCSSSHPTSTCGFPGDSLVGFAHGLIHAAGTSLQTQAMSSWASSSHIGFPSSVQPQQLSLPTQTIHIQALVAACDAIANEEHPGYDMDDVQIKALVGPMSALPCSSLCTSLTSFSFWQLMCITGIAPTVSAVKLKVSLVVPPLQILGHDMSHLMFPTHDIWAIKDLSRPANILHILDEALLCGFMVTGLSHRHLLYNSYADTTRILPVALISCLAFPCFLHCLLVMALILSFVALCMVCIPVSCSHVLIFLLPMVFVFLA